MTRSGSRWLWRTSCVRRWMILGSSPARTQQTLSRLLTRPILVHFDGTAWRADIEASFAKIGGWTDDVKTTVAVGDVSVPPRPRPQSSVRTLRWPAVSLSGDPGRRAQRRALDSAGGRHRTL